MYENQTIVLVTMYENLSNISLVNPWCLDGVGDFVTGTIETPLRVFSCLFDGGGLGVVGFVETYPDQRGSFCVWVS